MRRRNRATTAPTRDLELHRGPTTSCWLGRDEHGRLVVTKVAHPGADRAQRHRLLAQYRQAVETGGAAVLQPLDRSSGRDKAVTVWPFVLGRDLGTRLRRHGRLDPAWAAQLADGIDEAVAVLHARGAVHGALTPDHVLLDEGGAPLLIGLDPARTADAATRGEDRRAAAALRALLVDDPAPVGVGQDDRRAPRARGADLVLAGPTRRRSRIPAPVAAGFVVTLVGAAVAQMGRGHAEEPCPEVAARATADVDGDGCRDGLDWSAVDGRLTATTKDDVLVWDLGQPGDRLLVHDWDCDGAESPGLYRPSTGRTYAFDGWPVDGPAQAVEARPAEPCVELRGGVDPRAGTGGTDPISD